MRAPRRALFVALTIVVPFVAMACKKKAEPPTTETTMAAQPAPPVDPKVTSIDLGRAVSADKRVQAIISSFTTRDTVYAVVTTEGVPAGTPITAHWTYQTGQTVDSTTQTIAADNAVTQFQVLKPTGWPKGNYKVAISIDGRAMGDKEFEVK